MSAENPEASSTVMTEEEWLASTDVTRMLKFLHEGSKINDENLRLFAVECWSWGGKPGTWNAEKCGGFVTLVKSFAKEEATMDEVRTALQELLLDPTKDEWRHRSGDLGMAKAIAEESPIDAAIEASGAAAHVVSRDAAKNASTGFPMLHEAQIEQAFDGAYDKKQAELAQRLRDLVGNPFH